MRGVVQLRALAPLADPRSESPGESTLRLRWLDLTSLPPPTPQVPITVGGVEVYRIDLGVPELRYGCEYDGEAFHAEHERQDLLRREVSRGGSPGTSTRSGKPELFGSPGTSSGSCTRGSAGPAGRSGVDVPRLRGGVAGSDTLPQRRVDTSSAARVAGGGHTFRRQSRRVGGGRGGRGGSRRRRTHRAGTAGGEDPAPGAAGHRVDDRAQARVVAEHEEVDRRAVPGELVDLADGRRSVS